MFRLHPKGKYWVIQHNDFGKWRELIHCDLTDLAIDTVCIMNNKYWSGVDHLKIVNAFNRVFK